MSKQTLERTLKRELEILNDIIDHKIIKGMSYAREARRHKFISSQLADIRRYKLKSHWMFRSLGFASTI